MAGRRRQMGELPDQVTETGGQSLGQRPLPQHHPPALATWMETAAPRRPEMEHIASLPAEGWTGTHNSPLN